LILSDYIELQDRIFNSQKMVNYGISLASSRIGTSREEHPRYYLVYRNFDNEMKTNRWFAKYETESDRFGEQVSRIEFQGFDSLEDAQAFCEKNVLDVEGRLHGSTRPPETPGELRQNAQPRGLAGQVL
jgi:hypothetical protein